MADVHFQEVQTPNPQGFQSDLWNVDTVTHLETNLDDITGENLSYVMDLLLQNGAIDVWAAPIVMKKGRPAHTLHCLCQEDDNDKNNSKAKSLLKLIFLHSTTLGIRIYKDLPRVKLPRSFVTVQTRHENTKREGQVDLKIATFQSGTIVSVKPEFDHCKEIAQETGLPISAISQEAIETFRMKHRTDE